VRRRRPGAAVGEAPDAEILPYDETDQESAIAARTLVRARYTNVADLKGGMNAWGASGRLVQTDLD
jgi:rhodanese-related sulfurtransferase